MILFNRKNLSVRSRKYLRATELLILLVWPLLYAAYNGWGGRLVFWLSVVVLFAFLFAALASAMLIASEYRLAKSSDPSRSRGTH